MKAGSSPAIAMGPSCRRYSGRLGTVTIEHQAYTTCCSDDVELDVEEGPCWPLRTPHRVACNHGITTCSQCGGLALPLSSTSGIHRSTQPTGFFDGTATRHEHKTFPERLRDLSLELHEDFKNMRSNRALCEMVPLDLVDAFNNRQPDLDTSSTGKVGGPDLTARIGIVVFFRLLGSLQRNRNTAGILKLIKQVPSMIADTPVLSSWLGSPPAQQQHSREHTTDGAPTAFASLTTGASLGGVVDAIMSAAEELLLGNHKLSSKQRADVLGAMVGLAIKRGSLAHGLRVVKLLFCHAAADEMPPIPGVGYYLKELEATQPCKPGDSSVGASLFSDNELCESGVLQHLGQKGTWTAEGASLADGARMSSVPPALQGLELIQVSRTAFYHLALTADGELLTWSGADERARECGGAVAVADIPPIAMLERSQGMCHSTQSAGNPATGTSAYTWVGQHASAPMVLRVLADRAAVADVACGQQHTLALLETGQVFSWGGGGNGQLGLGDTRDRPCACLVGGIQEIEVEAVFCGVSHSLAVSSTGAPYAWGKNNRGQCGQRVSTLLNTLTPGIVDGLKDFRVASMAGGREHTLALTRCGQVFSFGGGYKDGRTGDTPPVLGTLSTPPTADGTPSDQGHSSPTKLCDNSFGSARVTAVSSGWDHSMVVTDDGSLFTWGSGRRGQLGHGDTEPRNVPTRVVFFSTPAGGRVRSATGGRSFSAVVTVDGRLFKWGLKSQAGIERAGGTGIVEGVGESRSGARREDTIATADIVESSVPRPVANVGIEDPRAVRLGEGASFDAVLVEQRSTAKPRLLPAGVPKIERSTRCLLTGGGLHMPEDPAQPVGRVETTVAILRHFERLALPHIPADVDTDVNCSVRWAVRVRKRFKKKRGSDGLRITRDQPHCFEAKSADKALGEQHMAASEPGTSRLADEPHDIKGVPISANRAPTPAECVPFCADTSREAFFSFLDLLQAIREKESPPTCIAANKLATAAKLANPSAALKDKHLDAYPSVAGNSRPESSPCEEPSPSGGVETEMFYREPATSEECQDFLRANETGLASYTVQMEVLRCTLRLLTVSLFHLARAAAVRCSCRDAAPDIHGSGSAVPDSLVDDMGGEESERSLAQDMHEVTQKLHGTLREILEEHDTETNSKSTEVGRSVQAEAAEAFRVGFFVFFPSNVARVRLLREIIKGITTTRNQHKENVDDKKKRRQSHPKSRRPPNPNGILVRVAMECLARENYAAALVAEAFGGETKAEKNNSSERSMPQDVETGVYSGERFDAAELEDAMQWLLSYCTDDLEGRIWGPDKMVSRGAGESGSKTIVGSTASGTGYAGEEGPVESPRSNLLLVLQGHVVAYSGDSEGDDACTGAAREVSLGHARRLFQESLSIFTQLLKERNGDDEFCVEDIVRLGEVRNSFVALVPLLCTSVVALPMKGESLMSRAAALLPSVIPLLGAVDRFNRRLIYRTAAPARDEQVTPTSGEDDLTSVRWVTGLEEALAMLSSELVCGLTEMEAINTRPGRMCSRSRIFPGESGCYREGDDQGDKPSVTQDTIELLLSSSPFLASGLENFNRSTLEDENDSRPDSPDVGQAIEVMALQERLTQKSCGCYQPTPARTSGPQQLPSNPTLSRPHGQRSLSRGRRRANSDIAAKLSPIGQETPPKRLGFGEESSRGGNQGSARRGAAVEAGGKGGRSTGSSPGRQLDSIVDEARAEGFIQDLLCGRGAAQTLYQWMSVPPESQHPVLHATSLATQGQGWGSYQSLGSSSTNGLGTDQQDHAGSHRRRRSRALSLGVDAATRALVGVLIKSNGLVTEAATFAKCRLDRASSPPPALKLVAKVAVELREALSGLADSLEEAQASKTHDPDQAHRWQSEDCRGQPYVEIGSVSRATFDKASAAATLAAIVRNCRFLLKRKRLPVVSLSRSCRANVVTTCPRQASTSRLSAGDQHVRRELSHTLRRWATKARSGVDASYEGPATDLAALVDHISKGRVEESLSAAPATQNSSTPVRIASLESLLAFAANPIILGDIEARMRTHELRAQVRASGLRLIHYMLQEAQLPAARRQIGIRLARSLKTPAGSDIDAVDRLSSGIKAGGDAATSIVYSAYVELCHHVVYELGQERCRRPSQENGARESSALMTFLPLLQALATMLTPSFLGHIGETEKHALAPGLAEGKAGVSTSRSEHAGSSSAVSQGWSYRLGRPSSTPSISRTDASAEVVLPVVDKRTVSVVIMAVQVLGSILGGEGDVLSAGDGWSPHVASTCSTIHHAAWRALAVINHQVCSFAFVPTSSAGGAGSFDRPCSNSSVNTGKQGVTAGVKQRWPAIQAMLSVLLSEVTRVHARLEQLLLGRHASKGVVAATRAKRLVSGPISLPFPTTPAFPELIEEATAGGFAVSFWVWVPANTTPNKQSGSFNVSPKVKRSAGSRNSSGECSRTTIFTRVRDASVGDGTRTSASRERPGVFLTWLPLSEKKHAKSGGFYVEVVVLRRTNSESKENQGGTIHLSTAAQDMSAGAPTGEQRQDVDGSSGDSNGFVFVGDSVFSECPLPPGRWTNVCCTYSTTGGPGEGSLPGSGSNGSTSCYPNAATIIFNGRVVAQHVLNLWVVGSEKEKVSESAKAMSQGEAKDGDGDRSETLVAASDDPHAPEDLEHTPFLCDLYWHPGKVSNKQARDMAEDGIRAQQEDTQHAAESYATRLVAVADEIASVSQQAAVALATSQWLSLWLKLGPVSGRHAQPAIVRLLRRLLCIRSPTMHAGEGVEGVRAQSKPPSGCVLTSSRSSEQDVGDRAIVEHLCGLLGDSLIPLLSRERSCRGGGETENELTSTCDESEGTSRRSVSALLRESSLVSEVVTLLRALVTEAPTRWREYIFASLSDGLAIAARGDAFSIFNTYPKIQYGPPTENESGAPVHRNIQSTAWLGAAMGALYLGGGHVEDIRLGARVIVRPRPHTANPPNSAEVCDEEINKVEGIGLHGVCSQLCVSANSAVLSEKSLQCDCRGTVVAWTKRENVPPSCHEVYLFVAIDEQYQDGLDKPRGHLAASQGEKRSFFPDKQERPSFENLDMCRVVKVRSRHVNIQEEIAEPMTPFLFELALPAVLALLESSSIPNAPIGLSTDPQRVCGASDQDKANIVMAHLRSRMVRALAVQLCHPGQAVAALRGRIFPPLLTLGATNLASAVVLALGSDGAVAFGRRRNFATVVLSLSHLLGTSPGSRSYLADLETACQVVWNRLSLGKGERDIRCRRSSTDGMNGGRSTENGGVDSSRPMLHVLGGEALVEGNRVTASSHFPTVRLSHVGVGLGIIGGRWYYEVTLLTGGLMQLGWAGPSFQCSPITGQGVGDHMHSWAFDGFRQKRWCVSSAPYGNRWRAGDVVGVLLDAGLQEMRFSLNGRDLGVAFVGLNVEGLYPAASMNVGQAACFNFGYSPFLYTPTDGAGSSFQPVTESVALNVTVDPESTDTTGTTRSEHPDMVSSRPRGPPLTDGASGGDSEEAGGGGADMMDDLSPRQILQRSDTGTDNRTEQSNNQSYYTAGSGSDLGSGEEGNGAQMELQRQGLVENLIGMGFPVEWAIRAAERSEGAVMNESAATAWIIERLEIENTKMEEEMGNMDACEEDSTGGHSGARGEYNDDVRESEDGDADVGGFIYSSEAAEIEGGAREGPRRINEDLDDRRWRDMYSDVRRSFLARSSGESPATAAAIQTGQHRPGVTTEGAWIDNEWTTSSGPSALPRAEGRATGEGMPSGIPCGLIQIALSTERRDLPTLGLVLDTALSILLARAAIVNLLSNLRPVGRFSLFQAFEPTVSPRLREGLPEYECPWASLKTLEHGLPVNAGHMISQSFSTWARAEKDGETRAKVVVETIAEGILEILAGPEHHQLVVDLTKALVAWCSAPCGVTMDVAACQTRILSKDVSAGARTNEFTGESESLEDSYCHGVFNCANTDHPARVCPRSCALAVRSLLEITVAPVKSWMERRRISPLKPSSAQSVKGTTQAASSCQKNDLAAWIARLPALGRFVSMLVSKAVSLLEESAKQFVAISTPEAGQPRENQRETLSPSSQISWAMQVIETLLVLESTYRGMGWPSRARSHDTGSSIAGEQHSVWAMPSGHDDGDADSGANAVILAVTSARSPQTLAALLCPAVARNLDAEVRTSAFALCSHILNTSRIGTANASPIEMAPKSARASERSKPRVVQPAESEEDEFALCSQERALARAFSARLRNELSTKPLASSLVQSQLELLVQWQVRRSAVDGDAGKHTGCSCHLHEEGSCPSEKAKVGATLSSRDMWNPCCSERIDDWDVATTVLAGVEGGFDSFDTAQAIKPRMMGSRRPGTAESEASALSNMPAPSLPGKLTFGNKYALLVEAASATSVTVSWGGWLDTDHGPELQVGVGGNGVAYPLSCSRSVGGSDLAQALRSKLKHAAGRRRQHHGPRLVLKVSAGGLWGSEPFRVAALDLGNCGCLKVHGLEADTGYSFRLERCTAPPSPPTAPPPGGEETSDDERSCFPSSATNCAASVGESTAVPLGTDVADGSSSALTGIDGSCGGGSACSEGYTSVHTDESRVHGHASCASSTRAVAGRNASYAGSETYTNTQTVDGEEWEWPSMGGRQRPCGVSGNSTSAGAETGFMREREEDVIVAFISVATPPEVPFMLDAEGCGPNLRLTSSNLTVTNTGRKRWSAVRATRGFNSGVHRWKVRVDRCVSKNVFVGVVSAESKLNNYVGSDRSGWGYLANKAIWHNKGKVRSYGDLFREGDTVGVSLNMDVGTLRFSRNGRDLGVAVQGLEGTLYPAFSMYNRNDQLTFVPPEDPAASTPIPSPVRQGDDQSSAGLDHLGRGAGPEETASNALRGTFSTECIVRRASKALEVLGALTQDGGLDSPAGAHLVENIRSCLLQWSRGEQGQSLSLTCSCAPVRLDTSEQARHNFFGLGTGDRVISAEGEATVLGATRHSIWVSLEPTSPALAFSSALGRGPRVWGLPLAGECQERVGRSGTGNTSAPAKGDMTSSPSHRRAAGIRDGKTTSWSRCTVRQILGRPEDYVISRGTTPAGSRERLASATSTTVDHDKAGRQEPGIASAVISRLGTDEIKNSLSTWTRAMDEELVRRLDTLAEESALTTALELPFDALESLPALPHEFPLTTSLRPPNVWARATLLLYVNDLVLPLLPLVDVSRNGRGPLGTMVRKCRHLIMKDAKMTLMGKVIRPAITALPSECGTESSPTYTISLSGIESLPATPVNSRIPRATFTLTGPSWAHTSNEVEKSVFGQVVRQLSCSPLHALDGPVAFSVELTDTSPPAEGEVSANVRMPDAHALYRGVFWQICAEVCWPSISMFVAPPKPAEGEIGKNGPVVRDVGAETPSMECRAAPDPLFASNWQSPLVSLDRGRVAYYRSLGYIAGLAVRTGVALPSLHLTATWWILVANEESSTGDSVGVGTERATPNANGVGENASWSDPAKQGSPTSVVDDVLAALGRIEAAEPAQEEALDEVLADARFVAPLSNRDMIELVPGGVNCPVPRDNLGEYRANLARLRASEYAPQAAAFRAGLEDALPSGVLSLMTWREMEELVCEGGSNVWCLS